MENTFTNSFYSRQRIRLFSWSTIIFAIVANVLIFLSISWVNRAPAHQPEYTDYTTIELFRPTALPEKTLPVIDSTPLIVDTAAKPKAEPMKMTVSKEFLIEPRLAEWIPEALLKQPGVSVNISLAEIDSSLLISGADISNALALNQVDRPPKKISGDLPDYPIWAQAKKVEGVVTLRFIVDVDGKVHNIKVHSIRGDQRFADAAKKAVKQWLFEPAVDRYRPVAVWCFQRINFKLEY